MAVLELILLSDWLRQQFAVVSVFYYYQLSADYAIPILLAMRLY
jgi:hypothetical protein